MQLAKKYEKLEETYAEFCELYNNNYNKLKGKVFKVMLKGKFIMNMFSQKPNFNTDYDAMKIGLNEIKEYAKSYNLSIAIPYGIGCGIANGDWNTVYKIIDKVFKDYEGTDHKTQKVESGKSATAPANPSREGYAFVKWDKVFSNITSDLVVTAQYEKITAPTFIVDNVNAKAGDTVQVAVNLQNNPGILGMALTIKFDENALKLTSASNGTALSALAFSKPGALKSGLSFGWDGVEVNPDDVKDGSILILTFEVVDNAAKGTYSIEFSYDDGGIIDGDLNSVPVNIINGNITVV